MISFIPELKYLLLPTALFVSSFFPNQTPPNAPPVAADDSYSRHGDGLIGSVLTNDFDPDGDTLSPSVVTFPSHGQLFGVQSGSRIYRLTDSTFTGTDSFTYRACDPQQACSNIATVTIQIGNTGPTANADSYIVHGTTTVGPMLANDTDPEGDSLSYDFVTAPSHGSLSGMTQQDMKRYTPHQGYVGADSFTYRACAHFFGTCVLRPPRCR